MTTCIGEGRGAAKHWCESATGKQQNWRKRQAMTAGKAFYTRYYLDSPLTNRLGVLIQRKRVRSVSWHKDLIAISVDITSAIRYRATAKLRIAYAFVTACTKQPIPAMPDFSAARSKSSTPHFQRQRLASFSESLFICIHELTARHSAVYVWRFPLDNRVSAICFSAVLPKRNPRASLLTAGRAENRRKLDRRNDAKQS